MRPSGLPPVTRRPQLPLSERRARRIRSRGRHRTPAPPIPSPLSCEPSPSVHSIHDSGPGLSSASHHGFSPRAAATARQSSREESCQAVRIFQTHLGPRVFIMPIPFHDHVQNRHDPSSIDGPQNTKKSAVAALLNFGWSRKGKQVEKPERVFDHPVNSVGNDPYRVGRTL